jgi:hypothetical protein
MSVLEKVDETTEKHPRVMVMVFNDTFNNISAISWQSVLLVEESGGPGENQTCCKSLRNFIP